MNTAFDFGGIQAFHSGLFAAFYFGAAFAVWVYYNHIRGDIALSLQSAASGLAHIFTYFIGVVDPTSPHLNLALAGYCCCASPTIMLCLREAIEPGWISWKRYFQYIGPFLIGTVLLGIFAREYIYYIMIVADLWFCCNATNRLIKGINRHEKLIKEYFAEIESYSLNWVRYFVYFQILAVITFFFLYENLSVTFNILFNYIMAAYWLYFLLMCKKYRYYSRQIPAEIQDDLEKQPLIGVDDSEDNNDEDEMATEKMPISTETFEFIENQLKCLEEERFYLDDSINLGTLSQKVGTNRTYMSQFFKAKKTSFWDYINQLRCEHAIKLMKTKPNLSMSSIALRAGYKTDGCFRTSFMAIYGKTPFAYKRQLKSED